LGLSSIAMSCGAGRAEAVPGHPRFHAIPGQCYESVGDYQSAYNQYTMRPRRRSRQSSKDQLTGDPDAVRTQKIEAA